MTLKYNIYIYIYIYAHWCYCWWMKWSENLRFLSQLVWFSNAVAKVMLSTGPSPTSNKRKQASSTFKVKIQTRKGKCLMCLNWRRRFKYHCSNQIDLATSCLHTVHHRNDTAFRCSFADLLPPRQKELKMNFLKGSCDCGKKRHIDRGQIKFSCIWSADRQHLILRI